MKNGWTPKSAYDTALHNLRSTEAKLASAKANLALTRDQLNYTELKADAAGTVTARGAEAGEVVQAGQMIVRIARQDGRDAVFDVPAQLLHSALADAEITVQLAQDPSVTAVGRVREVGEQADPVTRTFQVKVGLTDPPPTMRLGSTVNGSVQLNSAPVMTVPASALTRTNNQPAVWIVDPSKLTVSLRNIEVSRYDPGTVIVGQGLDSGDIVVTAGVQALHPDQKVRLLAPKL